MAHAIRMPKPGQMTEECFLTAWLKAEGDPVRRGDVLFEIETDKSSMEVEAFDDGVLLRRVAREGATVPVNAICGWVGRAGEEIPAVEVAAAEAVLATGVGSEVAAEASGGGGAPAATAEEAGSLASLPAPAPVAVAAGRAAGGPSVGSRAGRLRISPRATRLAAGAGIDPRTIVGTGPAGRIVERDVRAALAAASSAAAAEAGPPGGPARAVAGAGPVALPSFVVAPVEGEEPPRPLSRMRRVIAERLTASYQSIPHFRVTVSADVTRLMAYRTELKAAGADLTVTDFMLAATAQTLVEFPDVNSRTDGVDVYPRRRVHLGLAVAVPAGLVVPVIRDADRLTVGEIHDRATALGAAARDGKLTVDEMTGSTFTVSNLGMFGVDEFDAIINPGEAAILAVASALRTPVAIGDALAIRWTMKLTLSSDHRLVDGETAARFLNALRRRLEDARSFRLD